MRFFLIALLMFIACAQEPKEQVTWKWERDDKPYPTIEQLENGYIEVGWIAPGIPCTAKVYTMSVIADSLILKVDSTIFIPPIPFPAGLESLIKRSVYQKIERPR